MCMCKVVPNIHTLMCFDVLIQPSCLCLFNNLGLLSIIVGYVYDT